MEESAASDTVSLGESGLEVSPCTSAEDAGLGGMETSEGTPSPAMCIRPRIDLRKLDLQMRTELQYIFQEMARVQSYAVRPMFLKEGRLEYGDYPPGIQSYLDEPHGAIKQIQERYLKMANSLQAGYV